MVVNGLFILVTSKQLRELINLNTTYTVSSMASADTLNYVAQLTATREDWYELVVIVVAEHIIFILKFLIDAVIPDVPGWVRFCTVDNM